MMRRLLMSFALLLAACSAEPPADMTAYYAKPDGIAFTVAAAGNGDARVEAGDLTLLGFLARRLERRRADALAFRPTEAVTEFADFIRRELDFRRIPASLPYAAE